MPRGDSQHRLHPLLVLCTHTDPADPCWCPSLLRFTPALWRARTHTHIHTVSLAPFPFPPFLAPSPLAPSSVACSCLHPFAASLPASPASARSHQVQGTLCLKRWLHRYDTTGLGYLSATEFATALQALGVELTDAEMETVFEYHCTATDATMNVEYHAFVGQLR